MVRKLIIKSHIKQIIVTLGLALAIILAVPTYATTAKKENKATDQKQTEQLADNPTPDPYEKFNRLMFKINDFLDKYILKPTATLYNSIVPLPLNRGIDNFYDNLLMFPTLLNDFLQFNFYQLTSDSWRLVTNSTIGVIGFFDFASDMGLPKNYEGFGLTLARWGWVNSNFLYIPIFGPQTVRDAISLPIDYFSTPLPYMASVKARNYLFLLFLIDQRAQLLRFQKVYEEAALDPYIFQRNLYLQRRAYLIKRNKELNDPYSTAENNVLEEKQQTTSTTNEQKNIQAAEEVYYLDE